MLFGKKLLVLAFVVSYLGYLSWGIVAHTLKLGRSANPVNYFCVWDMFCGWSAWDQRTHVIAEGASGQYYEVSGPWGEFHPFGELSRMQYDYSGYLASHHIRNVLQHTSHEEIDRVYVVEEVWPKQYNMPPRLYQHYFDRPNDKMSYFHLRAMYRDDGNALAAYPTWHAQQALSSFYENPRLYKQAKQATSLYSTLLTPSRNAAQGNSMPEPISTN